MREELILHEVFLNGKHTITVTYKEYLSPRDAEEISEKIIDIISECDEKVTIIMDVSSGHAADYLPILKACAKLGPLLHKFEECYVVGNNEDNFKYAKVFFYAIGASEEHIHFVHDLEQVYKELREPV